MDIAEELSKFKIGSSERIFFEKVFDKLGPNFARKTILEEAKEASYERDKATQKYFEHQLVMNAFQKAVNEEDLQSKSQDSVHPFYLSLSKKYLPEDDLSSKPKLFGLTQKDIPQTSEREAAAFKKRVEDKIKEFCIELVECTGGKVYNGNWKGALDDTVQKLESKVSSLSVAKKDFLQRKTELQEMTTLYFKELSNGLSLLKRVLKLQDERINFERVQSDSYMLRSQALMLKSKILKFKILLDTYNSETVPALKEISSQLDQREKELKQEKNKATVALESYLKLGETYDKIVEEYMQLMKQIEEEQHAILKVKMVKAEHEIAS